MKVRKILGIALAATILLSACSAAVEKGDVADRQIDVITTIGMITDIVKNVGGERVSVIGLMGSGVDPHLYKASEGDVTKMANADIIFYNGLHLEAQMADVFEQMSENILTVPVTDEIDEAELLSWGR